MNMAQTKLKNSIFLNAKRLLNNLVETKNKSDVETQDGGSTDDAKSTHGRVSADVRTSRMSMHRRDAKLRMMPARDVPTQPLLPTATIATAREVGTSS